MGFVQKRFHLFSQWRPTDPANSHVEDRLLVTTSRGDTFSAFWLPWLEGSAGGRFVIDPNRLPSNLAIIPQELQKFRLSIDPTAPWWISLGDGPIGPDGVRLQMHAGNKGWEWEIRSHLIIAGLHETKERMLSPGDYTAPLRGIELNSNHFERIAR